MKKILSVALAVVMLMCSAALADAIVVQRTDTYEITSVIPKGYSFIETDYADVIGGLFKPENPDSPYYTLIVAYNDEYALLFGEESSLSDLTEEQLQAGIDELTRDFADPEVKVTTTGLGTVVIVVNEQGSESEYATVLSVYHGYFAQIYIDQLNGRPITDEEIQVAIDIMTSLTATEL